MDIVTHLETLVQARERELFQRHPDLKRMRDYWVTLYCQEQNSPMEQAIWKHYLRKKRDYFCADESYRTLLHLVESQCKEHDL